MRGTRTMKHMRATKRTRAMKHTLMMATFLLLSAGLLLAAAGADWLSEVPLRDQHKTNPFHDQTEAVQAGRLLFEDHCAQCHGDNAEGKKKRPSLRTSRIQSQASEGSLHWLLFNGNVRRGMPTWSKLPDQQLWQLVAYLKSLKSSE
jgi:mono/diheme cytochrome c family protein